MTARGFWIAVGALVALPAQAMAISAPADMTATLRAAATQAGCQAGAGADDVRWTAPAGLPSSILARLDGSAGGDWDLRLLDARGRVLDASNGSGSREVVGGIVRPGRTVVVRGCRRPGAAATARLRIEGVRVADTKPRFAGQLLKVRLARAGDADRLQGLGLDLGEDGGSGWLSVVAHGPADVQALRETGMRFEIVEADLAAADRRERRIERAAAEAAPMSALPSGRTGYRDYPGIQAELRDLAAAHPGLASVMALDLPTSQGREVTGIRLSKGAGTGRPTFVVVGAHHAREWPSAEVAMEWVHEVLGASKGLLDRIDVVVVPVQNPDGYTSSRDNEDHELNPDQGGADDTVVNLAGGILAYRRKTCSGPLPVSSPCDLQPGADSNRNYGADWSGNGSSSLPADQTYRGDAPWSETETENIHRLLQRTNATLVLSLHNVLGAVLRPPGVRGAEVFDEEALTTLGTEVAELAGYREDTFFGGLGYDGSGITEDWSYDTLGAFTYTIELGPSGGQFHMNYPKGVVEQWEGGPTANGGVRAGLIRLAEAAADPSLHSVLEGNAAPGATVTIGKTFKTSTDVVCTFAPGLLSVPAVKCLAPGAPMVFDDAIGLSVVADAAGRWEAHVTPSTRPLAAVDGETERWTVTCGGGAPVEATVERGERVRVDC